MWQVHNRFTIYNQGQHIYRHKLTEFEYINPALPNVTNVEAAMNWILAVLYPQTKPSVATPADLPLVGNTLNDYRVVRDDGDGKAASYRWETREGEGAPSWHKIYDMDWGEDSILENFLGVTNDVYVVRRGRTDIDGAGNPITGIYAGQRVWGGNTTGQNLTLNANSADATGFIQVENTTRPTANNTLDLGDNTYKFRTGIFGTSVIAGTLTIAAGLITDSSGGISFDNENLVTTGNITGTTVTGTTSVVANNITISAGAINSGSGAITFGSNNLTTTGVITGGINSKLADITFANGSITSSSVAINFGTNNLITTGTANFGNTTVTRLDADNIRLDANTISTTNTNGNLIILVNGSGVLDVQSAITSLGITATGTVGVTGQFNIDNLRMDGNIISSTNANGNIQLAPNGTGVVEFTSIIRPSTDNTLALGATANRFSTLFLGTGISDGTTSIASSVLQSLRDINVGATSGMSIFFDGTKWNASLPDTEITHSTLTGLVTGDAGHTQFVMLAGRSGGQAIIGGTAAAENLDLESTSNASKGLIRVKQAIAPFTNASFSGTWSGIDVGGTSNYFRNIYTKGELIGARLENYIFSGLPASSAQNIGRAFWVTDEKRLYVDTGSALQAVGVNKFISDVAFDGVVTTKTVTVSASVNDARKCIWALHDNANDYDRIYCSIKSISATQITITTHGALPAASYRLIGIE